MTQAPAILKTVSVAEAIKLAARDVPTFGQIWFSRTFRQKSPEFHYAMSRALEDPANRLIGFKIFRDGAKTTISRAYIMKRIAYCISRLILIVCINSTKAKMSLRWLMRQVDYNTAFAQAYGLKRGDKWTDEWATFINSEGQPVSVVALGITGGLRGFNIDDYRPDFIFCDDISDRENTATDDQRSKAEEAFWAQLYRSLAPASDAPLSQLAIAQTPINAFDIISQAERDPEFRVITHSCLGPDGQSTWPARRSTDSLLKEKAGYIARNQLATWLAEMECKIVAAKGHHFQRNWLKYFSVFPVGGEVVICCDPASSESPKADYFAIAVLLFYQGKVFLLDYKLERNLMPDAACAAIFNFAQLYSCRRVVVETVAYQKIMKWYLEQEIQARRMWLTVESFTDRRKKEDRIVQAFTAVAPFGQLLIREEHAEFVEAFELYGPEFADHDDLLDAVSIGISWKFGKGYGGTDDNEAIEAEFRRLRDAEEELSDVNDAYMGAP